MISRYKFHFSDNELICCKIDSEEVSFKLGELFGFEYPEMEFEEISFLNEIHQTDKITEAMLAEAKDWWEENKESILEEDDMAIELKRRLICRCGEAGHYHCSELRAKVEEMRQVLKLIIEADCLRPHAFERGDDDASVYELCKAALKFPGE